MTAAAVLFVSVLLAFGVTTTNAYSSFKDSIPNGHNVPHPCNKDMMWDGVGHTIPGGAGPVNKFGEFFKTYWWWSPEVCNDDSDGDGMTNGQELGDPNCWWYQGSDPERTYNISHPGICEPIESEYCKEMNDFLDCSDQYSCPQAMDPGVERKEYKLTMHEVPQREMSSFCANFELPQDQDYHIIATEAMIENADVAYSMYLYGCPDYAQVRDYTHECDWMDNVCTTFYGMWSPGASDMCYGDVGFRVGPGSSQSILVKVSYKNPNYVEGLYDSSGMAVYLKPAADEGKDLSTLMFGTQLMEIPPGQYSYEVESICKGDCTNFVVTSPATIWGALNMMNKLGTSMRVELFRGGMKMGDVTWDDDYDVYKRSVQMPKLDLQPGDEVKVTCVYNTMDVDGYTRYGETLSDEMCQAYVLVYPASAVNFLQECWTYSELDICDYSFQTPITTPMGMCNWYDFTIVNDTYTPKWMTEVGKACSEDGYCRQHCKDTVQGFMDMEPCFAKEAQLLVNYQLTFSGAGHRGMAALNTCRGTIYSEMEDNGDDDHGDDSHNTCTWEECYYNYCNVATAPNTPPPGTSYYPYDAAPSLAASSVVVMTLSVGIFTLV